MHRRMAVGAVALSFVLAIGVALSGALAPGGGTALGASTTLTIISGDVLVSREGGPFMAAVDGEVLEPGDAVRTGHEARAVLTYFEGSTVTIEPWSELSIDEASAEPDGSTVVLMTQNLGRTWHVVTKLITGGSRYEVRTPAATASVRGTAFEVGVARTETGEIVTDVVTAEGMVAAAAPATQADPAPQSVLVQAGFQTTARSNERAPEAPVRAPEPVRTVSVNVRSENTLVVDPLGRANGVKDGKVILQTPGASVSRVDGKVIVTMPNIPDGKIATVVNKRSSGSGSNESAPVEVVTTVEERGKPANTVSESVVPTSEPATTGVEVRQSGPGPEATPALRPMREDETKQLPTPKTSVEAAPAVSLPAVGDALRAVGAVNAGSNARASGGQSAQAAPAETRRSEEQRSGSSGFFPAIPLGGLPGAQSALAEQERRRAEEERKRFEDDARRAAEQAKRSAEEAAKRAAEDAQRAAEAARKTAEETARRAQEQEQARKAAEEAAKRAAEDKRAVETVLKAAEEAVRRAEEQAKQAAEAARRAEDQAKLAAEQARKAADDVAQRAEQEAKKAADEAKKLAPSRP